MVYIGIPGCYRVVCHWSGSIGAWVTCAWHVSPCPILRSSTLEDVRCCLLDDQIRAIFDRIQPVVATTSSPDLLSYLYLEQHQDESCEPELCNKDGELLYKWSCQKHTSIIPRSLGIPSSIFIREEWTHLDKNTFLVADPPLEKEQLPSDWTHRLSAPLCSHPVFPDPHR